VGEVAQEWFETLDVKPRSREAYELHIRLSVIPFLGSRQIQSLRPKDCSAFAHWLKDERGQSPASQHAALSVLNQIFRYAVREEYVPSNPLERIDRRQKRQKKAPHRYLSPDEVRRLLENSNGYRPLFELCVFTGLRMSEALGLVWSDIDLTEGLTHVTAQLSRATNIADATRVSTKNDETRDVNIDPDLVELLRGLKAEAFSKGRAQGDAFVFQTDSGNPYLYRNVWAAFDLAATRGGLNDGEGRKLRPHDLRRTFASLLINAGRPAPYVAKQLGHTVPVLYATYTGLLEAQEGTNREAHLEALKAFRRGVS